MCPAKLLGVDQPFVDSKGNTYYSIGNNTSLNYITYKY